VKAERPEAARDLLRGAEPIAVKQPEPRRSRCLAMIVQGQVEANDVARATANVEAIRDYPGLEKQRAWNILARWHEKAGDHEGAAKVLRQALANAEAKAPETPQMGRQVSQLTSIGRTTFVDPDLELAPGWVEFDKRSRPIELRVKLGDLDGALRLAESLPSPQERDTALSSIVTQLAAKGDIRAAIELASTIKSADKRLGAIQLVAGYINK
jgi:hypothetical protein